MQMRKVGTLTILALAACVLAMLRQNHAVPHATGCITSVSIGSSSHAGSVLPCPWFTNSSFYFITNGSLLETVRAHGWTAVLLNVSQIPFDPSRGPTSMPELGWTQSDTENIQAKYVKILSHRIPELARCDVVLYMDSKLSYERDVVLDMLSEQHPCATLFRHPWRTYTDAYGQEVADSLNAARYSRFKPALDLQIRRHRHESLDGVMHLGGTHLFNLRNPEAVRMQNSWWDETVAYSIQDQLSLFWQLRRFKHCVTSQEPAYGTSQWWRVKSLWRD